MNVNINNKWAIIIVFLLLAILTFVAGLYDDNKESESQKDQTEKVEKGNDQDKDKVVVNPALETDPYKELDELIGLGSVKQEVRSLANFVKLQNKRKAKGMKTPKLSYHLVFTGSPGTGKTTVARIVARIYKDLGILKKGVSPNLSMPHTICDHTLFFIVLPIFLKITACTDGLEIRIRGITSDIKDDFVEPRPPANA